VHWNKTSKGFEIDLDKAPESRRMMAISRKFPAFKLKKGLSLDNTSFVPANNGQSITVSIDTQIKTLEKVLTKPFDSPYFLAIGVDDVEDRAITLAGSILLSAIDYYFINKDTVDHLPYWHWVTGGHWDRLRDNRNSESSTNFSMLFLSNVAKNSTPEKIEKVRDLIQLNSHLPRILIIAGGDPLLFCVNSLYIRPNRVLYLSSRSKTKVVYQI
jgi:hypothetical protein